MSTPSQSSKRQPRPGHAGTTRPATTTTTHTLAGSALFKIVAAAALIWLVGRLGRLVALVFLALLLSIALSRIVSACTRRGLPAWVGVALSALSFLSVIAAFVCLLLPAVANQGAALISHLPDVQKELIARLPSEEPIRDAANTLLDSASFSDPQPLLQKLMNWGAAVLTSLSELLLVLVIAIDFLIDGDRIYHWLLAFLPPRHRAKVRTAAPEIVEVVSRYVDGQFITSTLCGTYAFAVLYFLHVPNAALLAVFAAIVDILPVIGFFLFIIPAVALAFTVSPLAAALSALLYGAYHLLEAYLIAPKVYGNQLKLSTLTVLLASMAGWLLAGVLGAIAILPVVASYPIIERLWLEPHLEPDTVPKHEAIEDAAHSGT
jgi:predicted PurR-regulated permease PerM